MTQIPCKAYALRACDNALITLTPFWIVRNAFQFIHFELSECSIHFNCSLTTTSILPFSTCTSSSLKDLGKEKWEWACGSRCATTLTNEAPSTDFGQHISGPTGLRDASALRDGLKAILADASVRATSMYACMYTKVRTDGVCQRRAQGEEAWLSPRAGTLPACYRHATRAFKRGPLGGWRMFDVVRTRWLKKYIG